ncbi:MAG: hemolysin family protein [Candidatus Woesearchaeota archaeon]
MIFEILLLVILITGSAFFAGVETAFVSMSNFRLHHLIQKKEKKARLIKKLKDDYDRLIITLLIGNNFVNIGASALATAISINLFGSAGVGIATGVMTFIILVFGEITPKNIAMAHNEKICLMTAPFVNLLVKLFYPLSFIFQHLTRSISGIFPTRKRPEITEDEIKSVINLGEELGEVEEDEREMIYNIFRFSDMKAKDIMVPFDKVFYINEEDPVSKIIPRANRRGFSRIPVFSKKHNSLIGILYIKDILKNLLTDLTVKELMRPAIFAPEKIFLDNLLRILQKKKVHFAILKKDDGSIAGILTLEDILEEIVGEIYDETDIDKTHIRKVDENNYIIDGNTTIYDLNMICHLRFKGREYETIENFLKRRLNKELEEKDTYSTKKATMLVESTSKRLLIRVNIR